eukprot:Hpha_TRINITY_DN29006_c0_g1::TRINITY_DN29006_c0_g1_i1::g.156549::m.156549
MIYNARRVNGRSRSTESSLPQRLRYRYRPIVFMLSVCLIILLSSCSSVGEDLRRGFLRGLKGFWQGEVANSLRLAASPTAKATYKKARRYFELQYPFVEDSARRFRIHPYFANLSVPSDNVAWFEAIRLRMRRMREALERDGSDDFRVEKDRCEMYRFFARAGIPHVPVLRFWDSLAEVEAAIMSGEAWSSAGEWPVFLKACHLTQGSMKAVLQVQS